MKQLLKILQTDSHRVGIIYRVTIAAVLFPHGCQQMLGWFGGYGFTGTMDYFTGTVGLPWIIGFIVIFLQFFGSLFILAGLATRIIAPASIIMFIGMILTGHLDEGFFMNWMGNQTGEGFEYHLLFIGLFLALFVNGSGKYSVDRLLFQKIYSQKIPKAF
jgi:putative oxidoreductase